MPTRSVLPSGLWGGEMLLFILVILGIVILVNALLMLGIAVGKRVRQHGSAMWENTRLNLDARRAMHQMLQEAARSQYRRY